MDPEQRAKTPWVPGFLKPLERNMLDLDEPDHVRLRALVSKAFTPRLIERLRGRTRDALRKLLDAIERKGARRGSIDLGTDYALPLPATVITELLGVPAEDQARFYRWSNRLVSVSSGRDMLRTLLAALAFTRYLRKLIDRRRPQGRSDHGLVQAKEAGDKLTEDELLAMAFLLLVADHETTVKLIASATLALPEHPRTGGRAQEQPFARQACGRRIATIEEAAAHPLGHKDSALKLCLIGLFGHRATRRSLHVDQTGTLSLTYVEPKRRSCWRLSQAA